MASSLSNLRIEKVIVHQIFKREEDDFIPPVFSGDFTNLDKQGLATLQERIINALGSDSFCTELTIRDISNSSAFAICARMLDVNESTFIHLSCDLVKKLADSQRTRNIPGGIVVVFTGWVGVESRRYVGMIKAESHSGFSIHNLKGSLLLEFLSQLFLTPQQKLYKVALFINRTTMNKLDSIKPDDFQVLVYDHNMTKAETSQLARYFYEAFLGCEILPDNKKFTHDFYFLTKEFIDDLIVDWETKIDLTTALYTYLKISKTPIIEVADFSRQYLQPEIQDIYLKFMLMKNFTTNSFIKDFTNLKYKLRNRNWHFTSEVRIIAPAENFDELVKIKESKNGHTIVSIEGLIEKDD
jgi:hypothetical protein